MLKCLERRQQHALLRLLLQKSIDFNRVSYLGKHVKGPIRPTSKYLHYNRHSYYYLKNLIFGIAWIQKHECFWRIKYGNGRRDNMRAGQRSTFLNFLAFHQQLFCILLLTLFGISLKNLSEKQEVTISKARLFRSLLRFFRENKKSATRLAGQARHHLLLFYAMSGDCYLPTYFWEVYVGNMIVQSYLPGF